LDHLKTYVIPKERIIIVTGTAALRYTAGLFAAIPAAISRLPTENEMRKLTDSAV